MRATKDRTAQEWGRAFEVTPHSNLAAYPDRILCSKPDCHQPFEVGQWVRYLYTDKGGWPWHDDCSPAKDY